MIESLLLRWNDLSHCLKRIYAMSPESQRRMYGTHSMFLSFIGSYVVS